jgi:hypothetical protein
MKSSFTGASLVAIGLLSLLSACASTSSADSPPAGQKVASNCEVIPPATGSNLPRRHCESAPAQQTNSQSTSQ